MFRVRIYFIPILLCCCLSICCSISYGDFTNVNQKRQQSLSAIKNNSNHQKIIFLRHGEKPANGMGQLTCRGFNRALALIHTLDIKYGQPDYIFAPKPVILKEPLPFYYVRPLVTIEPFAINFNHVVNTQYGYEQVGQLIKELLSPPYHSAVIFVAWEHLKLVEIVRSIIESLHGDPEIVPPWMRNDYDSLYIIDIDWQTRKVQFIREAQNLNGQNKTCRLMYQYADRTSRSKQKKRSEGEKNSNNMTQTILFIPEAENYVGPGHHLNCQGLHRALALQEVLTKENRNIDKNIDMFISANTEISSDDMTLNDYNYTSGIMTIEPTAIRQVRPIFCPYEVSDIRSLKSFILKPYNYRLTNAVVLPTKNLLELVTKVYQAVGGNENDIPKERFDINTIHKLVIIRKADTQIDKFTLTSFSENIYPSSECNF